MEATLTYKNCKLSDVARHLAGWGFNIVSERGRPLVVLNYETEAEANEAHTLIATAVVGAALTPHV
jgi:hypothetical protein